MGEPSADAGSRSWWQTLPGMLTAVAALISAITGLVVAFQQLRGNDHSSSSGSSAAADAGSANSGNGSGTSSQEAPSDGGTTVARVSFPQGRSARVGDASYRVLTASARTVNPGELMLALRIRLANQGQYDANFWSRTFRLRVGGDTGAPTNFLDEVVPAGTTKLGDVDFSIRAATRRATLLVGDDASNAVALPLRLTPPR